jgi:hypothetical protein
MNVIAMMVQFSIDVSAYLSFMRLLRVGLRTCLVLYLLTPAIASTSWAGSQRDAVCQGSCGGGCGPCPDSSPSPGYTQPTYDYEAERRAREAAAEEQRKREAELERQRKEAEEKRIKEQTEKEAKFIKDRDESAGSLKGSTGMKITPNSPGTSELRGSTGFASESGLRDALNDKGLRGSKPAASADRSQLATAWKQLHCASYVAGFALKALQEQGDYQEFGALSVEAMKTLDGQHADVECPSAPAMPNFKGGMVDMERMQGKEQQILERAGKIAERMKKSEAKKMDAKEPAPANETEIEKVRRVQKELNKVNSEKNDGKTKAEIDEKEKDRKELTKLIIENEKLTSVGVDLGETTPTAKRKRHTEPPSPVDGN